MMALMDIGLAVKWESAEGLDEWAGAREAC